MWELRELSVSDGEEILEMLWEIGPGESGFVNSAATLSAREFPDYLRQQTDFSLGLNLPEKYVPQTVYWLYVDGYPTGMGKIRHFLNDNLRIHGGHIGYTIRPSRRSSGYGKILLAELLREATTKGISKALLTCYEINAASRKIIESNGGVLESVTDGNCRYWIELSSEKSEGIDA